ncbi:hypothetical protein RHSIM_Rhsim07G0111100 [Rhododendron simsii]|uniref:Uncharacterized protein n=1 Tax=Rhododendron simsii TaxID=118357 RepID=A0A834GQT3_RHOSS|nr:hypothetical protein RHSIM_Rhsim07G0111100 [Rhododendron simsii]
MPRPSTGRTFNGGINVAFINVESYNVSQQRPAPAPRHTIYAFLISSLFNFLDLQYQGNGTASPFQTHPKIMWVAVSSSLLYCFAFAMELEPRFAQLGRGGMGLFVPVLLSLLQIKYQGNQISPFETHPISMVIFVASLLLYCLGYNAKSRWPTYALIISRAMVAFGSLSVVSLASILFPNSFRPVLYFLYVLVTAAELLKLLKWVHRKIVGMLPSQLTSTAAFSNIGGVAVV